MVFDVICDGFQVDNDEDSMMDVLIKIVKSE